MRNFTLVLLTIFNSCLAGQNFIATYNFANVTTTTGLLDPGPAPVVDNLILGNFSASNPGSNPGASGRFSFSGWPVGAADGVDEYWNYTSSLSPFTYYEVGMKIAPNHTLELKTISFYVRRSGTGIRNYCVRSTLDNYGSNIGASTGTNVNLEVLPEEVFFWKYDSISTSSDQRGSSILLGKEFSGITDTIAFRIYAWNAEASGGTFSIDNVTFGGYVKDTSFYSGLPAPDKSNRTKIYPNPTNGKVLNIESEAEIYEVIVLNLDGRNILSCTPDTMDMQLAVSSLEPGMYVIRLRGEGTDIAKKLLVTER
jgi:hypothetical protein